MYDIYTANAITTYWALYDSMYCTASKESYNPFAISVKEGRVQSTSIELVLTYQVCRTCWQGGQDDLKWIWNWYTIQSLCWKSGKVKVGGPEKLERQTSVTALLLSGWSVEKQDFLTTYLVLSAGARAHTTTEKVNCICFERSRDVIKTFEP